MKIVVLGICLLCLTSTWYGCLRKADNIVSKSSTKIEEVVRIDIKYTDMDILTPISVSCEEFENYFKNPSTIHITNRANINRILSYIAKANLSTGSYMDARMKMIFLYDSGKTEIACFNTTYFLLNNQIYHMNNEFLTYINEIIKAH